MKKIVFLVGMMLVLTGCGNAAQTSAEAGTTEVESTEVQETETVKEAAGVEAESADTAAMEETVETDETTEVEEIESATAQGTEAVEETETTAAKTAGEEAVKEVTETVTVFDQPKTMYATIALNVRRGPSTDYEVVSHLAVGQEVEITGQAETGWYQMMVDGVPAYASHKYISENKVEVTESAPELVPLPAAKAPETAGQPAQAETQPQTPTAAVAPAGVIMVGDSRCVQMQAAVGGGGCSWICENSKEYTWFSETAIPKFDQYVGKGTKVVINMGVNDPEHYNQYVELVNAKAAEWAQRGAKTYFVSVNPVWENPYTDQEDVDTFNANVPGMLAGVTWIDTSSWLNTNGYRLLDGLHYDDPTYVNIFNLIMGSL